MCLNGLADHPIVIQLIRHRTFFSLPDGNQWKVIVPDTNILFPHLSFKLKSLDWHCPVCALCGFLQTLGQCFTGGESECTTHHALIQFLLLWWDHFLTVRKCITITTRTVSIHPSGMDKHSQNMWPALLLANQMVGSWEMSGKHIYFSFCCFCCSKHVSVQFEMCS